MSSHTHPHRPHRPPGDADRAPASGAQPPSRQLRLAVAAERVHSAVQPRFLTTLFALGSTLGALSVVLAWLLR